MNSVTQDSLGPPGRKGTNCKSSKIFRDRGPHLVEHQGLDTCPRKPGSSQIHPEFTFELSMNGGRERLMVLLKPERETITTLAYRSRRAQANALESTLYAMI